MRTILFGAGASYGSGEVLPKPPPLGGQLFAALQRLFPTWRSIPESASEAFQEHFESGMAVVIEKYGYAVGPLMQEMAKFFAIFGMDDNSANLYRDLVKEVAQFDDVILATLNYECLLEIAISLEGQEIGYFMDPGEKKNQMPVWKLHGSCNFVVEGMEATRGVTYSGSGVTFGGSIRPINPSEVRGHYSGNTSLYPSMALYASGKPISMSPGPVKAGQEKWGHHVRAADRIALIGVNPFPEDRHIWDPIVESSAEIAVIGDVRAFEKWASDVGVSDRLSVLGSRWGNCSDELIEFITT